MVSGLFSWNNHKALYYTKSQYVPFHAVCSMVFIYASLRDIDRGLMSTAESPVFEFTRHLPCNTQHPSHLRRNSATDFLFPNS